MENQHQKIEGYRDFGQSTIDKINEVKAKGNEFGELIEKLEQDETVDKVWLEDAKKQLQIGTMLLVRSIAKPDSF